MRTIDADNALYGPAQSGYLAAMPTKRLVVIFTLLAGSLVADQATKVLAIKYLKGQPPLEFGGFARLVYAENSGAFLGLGRDWPDAVRMALFIGLAAIATGVAIYILLKKNPTRMTEIGIVLFAGGAVGNLFDRIFREGGRVVDFAQLGFSPPLMTGVFNVADVLLMAAIPFFLFSGKKKKKPASDELEAR